MKFMAPAFIVLLALLSGCARATYEFTGEGSWSSEEEAAIINGGAEWPDYGVSQTSIRVEHDDSPDGCPPSPNPGMLAGTMTDLGKTCFYIDRIHAYAEATGLDYLDVLQRTAAHEYGHILGLHHDDNETKGPSIMKAYIQDETAEPTAYDLAAVHADRD